MFVTVRILHIVLIFCSRSISGSLVLLLHWRISRWRRSWAKANNPYWSSHVATWYAGHQDVEEYCQRRDLSPATLVLWAQHLVSLEDLRKRKERLRNLRQEAPKRQHKREQSKRERRPRRYRYGVRTDSGPIALQAFWGMHVEAMNFSGMGHAEYAAALDRSPHALRIWRDRLEQSGNEMDWRNLLHPSARAQLSSAANCARCKDRLTPQEGDRRSNRAGSMKEIKSVGGSHRPVVGDRCAPTCSRQPSGPCSTGKPGGVTCGA